MKVIQITDDDAKFLVDRLELVRLRKRCLSLSDTPSFEEMHRVFHYEVVTWLHKHGARLQ